ncbi:MAG: helix-turn-helix transcriptional regulator [Ruminococcus sp.]|nr:helix-turn-helix transcriptional regulator [Ruminococcus sp.]
MPYYQRIRDLREDSDKTQSDIAHYLGTTAQYYGKYEKGEREIPLARAIELANYYSVSLDYLSGRTNIKQIQDDNLLSEDEIKIISLYRELTERNKGKAEIIIEQLYETQAKDISEIKAHKKEA